MVTSHPEPYMPTHETINGRKIEYEQTAAESRFLRRVEATIDDEHVSELELRALIYGPDNPLLDHHAGYTFVVSDVFDSALFRVLLDYLDQKRVRIGSLDPTKVAARYTLTTAEAADRAGVGGSTLRTAVADGRLPAWIKEGLLYFTPESVDGFVRGNAGRRPRLRATSGSEDGASLRLRVAGGKPERKLKVRSVVELQIDKWDQVAVITGATRPDRDDEKRKTYRYWLIEPGGAEDKIGLDQLRVEGRFTVREKHNGDAARSAWREFTRAHPEAGEDEVAE